MSVRKIPKRLLNKVPKFIVINIGYHKWYAYDKDGNWAGSGESNGSAKTDAVDRWLEKQLDFTKDEN